VLGFTPTLCQSGVVTHVDKLDTKTKNHHASIKELNLGPFEAMLSIFHTGQAHADELNTKTNIESPEKDPNWKSFWR
jgi:hypothetical protein